MSDVSVGLGTGAFPAGTTGSTQAPGDKSADLSTDAFVNAALLAIPLVNAVAEFGVDNTGTVADTSPQINVALAAGAAGGFGIYLSPGTYNLQNPIKLGNGGAAISTVQGGLLVGAGFPGDYQVAHATPFQKGLVTLNWNGTASGTMVEVLGPLQGWGLRNLYFYGGGAATITGLLVSSAQYGYCSDLTFEGCATAGICETCNQVGTFAGPISNTMHNLWERIGVIIPNGANGIQIGKLQGLGPAGNTCYETFNDLTLILPNGPSNATPGLLFQLCDNIRVNNVHFPVTTSPGNSTRAIWLYSTASGWPSDIYIDNPDFGGLGNGGGAGWSVYISDSGSSPTHVVIRNPGVTNSTSPNAANIVGGINAFVWDAPGQPTGVLAHPPSVPASGASVTNVFGVPCTVYLNGAVTGISVGGTTIGELLGPVRVAVGQTITLTYSSAPTWVWVGD